jgi:hypothetical protein
VEYGKVRGSGQWGVVLGGGVRGQDPSRVGGVLGGGVHRRWAESERVRWGARSGGVCVWAESEQVHIMR